MFLGDIVGRAAREKVVRELPHIKTEYMIDFAIVNGENSAGGFGITEDICNDLFLIWSRLHNNRKPSLGSKRNFDFISDEDRLLRPVNFPNHTPGSGFNIFETEKGKILVINVMGRLFMDPLDDPFKIIDELLTEQRTW